MTKMKWPLIVAGFCVITFLVIVALPAEPGVTRTNYSRIRPGMHKSEIEALFGSPGCGPAEVPQKWLGLFLM